jgi:hypothetical protein
LGLDSSIRWRAGDYGEIDYVALEISRRRLQADILRHRIEESGDINIFVAADQRLCTVASIAGCSAVNPQKIGPLLG